MDASGEMYLTETGKIVYEIDKESISVSNAQEQFKKGRFTMTNDFVIPSEITKAINSPKQSLVISAGVYTYRETKTHYVIEF